MTRDRRTLRLAGAAALALVLLGAWLIHLSSPARGPVQFTDPWTGADRGVVAGLPTKRGGDAVYGIIRIENSSPKTAHLVAVRAVGHVDPLRAFLAETRLLVQLPGGGYPGGQIGTSDLKDRFSRSRWAAGQMIPGAVLPPRTAGMLMLRFYRAQPGEAYWPRVELDYEIEGRLLTSAGALGVGFGVSP